MRRGLILLPLLALVLIAAACSSGNGFQPDPVAAAAAKTDEAGSSRIAFELAADVLGRDVSLRGQGAYDYEASRGRFEVDASSLVSGATVEVRAVDSTLYVRVPTALSLWAPAVKPWVAVRGGQALAAYGLGELQQDPGQLLGLLRASSTRVTKSGTEVVRGVETTRYTAELDLTKTLEANAERLGLTELERTQLRRAAQELRRQAKLTTLPVDVFVDGDGLVRRLTLAADGNRISVDFWDFGADVDVQAPPAAEVQKLYG